MTLATTFNGESIRATFQEWSAERESLDSELSESFAALEAYQQNLDDWQRQLAEQREQLQAERGQFAQDQAAAQQSGSEASAKIAAELEAAREKTDSLTALLLSQTEDLRMLDNSRAEAQAELELSRAREQELRVALDEHKRSLEQERSQWADELKQVRESLERQMEAPAAQAPAAQTPAAAVQQTGQMPPTQPAPPASVQPQAPTSGSRSTPRGESPVLGSIIEQFGKLRQQRAVERQSNNRKG
jgi:septal ring factor EnvC (AmiA/AmiB activator)